MLGRLMLGFVALCALSSAAALDYVPDGTFNAGTHYLESFSGPPERHYVGQRIVRLPDGASSSLRWCRDAISVPMPSVSCATTRLVCVSRG